MYRSTDAFNRRDLESFLKAEALEAAGVTE